MSGHADKNILVATDIMKGTTAGTTYAAGDVVHKNNEWYTLANPTKELVTQEVPMLQAKPLSTMVYLFNSCWKCSRSSTRRRRRLGLVDAAAGGTSAATAAATLLAMTAAGANSTAAVLAIQMKMRQLQMQDLPQPILQSFPLATFRGYI